MIQEKVRNMFRAGVTQAATYPISIVRFIKDRGKIWLAQDKKKKIADCILALLLTVTVPAIAAGLISFTMASAIDQPLVKMLAIILAVLLAELVAFYIAEFVFFLCLLECSNFLTEFINGYNRRLEELNAVTV